MRMREKGKRDGDVVTMGWDEAQAALQAGTHEVADADGSGSERPRDSSRSAGDDAGGSGEQGGDDLDAKTRAELDAIAAERGVDVSKAKTKDDVIKALRAAQ